MVQGGKVVGLEIDTKTSKDSLEIPKEKAAEGSKRNLSLTGGSARHLSKDRRPSSTLSRNDYRHSISSFSNKGGNNVPTSTKSANAVSPMKGRQRTSTRDHANKTAEKKRKQEEEREENEKEVIDAMKRYR